MLHIRVFIYRYKLNKNAPIFMRVRESYKETTELVPHYKLILKEPNKVKPDYIKMVVDEVNTTQAQLIKLLTSIPKPQLNKQAILGYLKLYNESVQALLEGKREAMTNKEFKFQDGESVQQKVDKYVDKLKHFM